MSESQGSTISNPGTAAGIPAALRDRLNGDLKGESVVAWSQFDLDESNAFAQRFVVMTNERLVIVSDGTPSRAIPIAQIEEAKIVEGVGVDRLNIVVAGKLAAEMRYSRRFQRDMSRLQRKIERRLPGKQNGDRPPEWLELVEREAEAREICKKCGALIPAYAEGVCPACLHKRSILWRLLAEAKPYRHRVWIGLFWTLLWPVCMAVGPIIQKIMIDEALDTHALVTGRPIELRLHNLYFWSGIALLIVFVSEAVNGARMYTLARLGTQITADIRHKIYAHLHELSLRYFSKRRTGSLITRVTSDTDRLWDFIAFGSIDFIRNAAMIVLYTCGMFYLSPRLAAYAMIPLPILATLAYFRGIKMQKMFGRLWTYWSRITAVVGDAVPGVRVVKAFANEDREIARFDRRSNEYTEKEQAIHAVWTTLAPMIGMLMRTGAWVVWLIGGYMIITKPEQRDASGHVIANAGNSLGVLVAFTAYVWQFYQPIMELANSSRMLTRAATSAQRVFEVLDTQPEIFSRNGAVTKDHLDGNIEFNQVSFSYEGAQPALREISFKAERGQMIGLCGTSGAGKSTLVNLICRFYDVTDGQLLIDGIDIRDYDVRWLRRQIGMVLQEPYLFHGTVAENIAYGNPDASEAQIIASARAANAHDFIVAFPDGYDTMVGERGQSLSGGERQRISIARAILHNPRILILDEATSSVDSETEKQIQQALDRLVEGRTTFAIAHRLSTLQAADRLVVLDKGKVVEEGKHDELLKKEDGQYAKLHKTQMEMATVGAFA